MGPDALSEPPVSGSSSAPPPPHPPPTWLSTDRAATPSAPPKPKTLTAPSTNVPSAANIPISARRSERLDLNTVERKGRPLPGWREPAARVHAGGIKEAPTFRPNEDEWRNPAAYIKSISEEGSKYGIVKIIPPDSWAPDFAIDTEVSLSTDPLMFWYLDTDQGTAFPLQDTEAGTQPCRRWYVAPSPHQWDQQSQC